MPVEFADIALLDVTPSAPVEVRSVNEVWSTRSNLTLVPT
jgi:hypothetical protein